MKFEPKPNHYYKRTFKNCRDDIIKVSTDGDMFDLVREVRNGKWEVEQRDSPYLMRCISTPMAFVEYSSLEELMADMFLELI